MKTALLAILLLIVNATFGLGATITVTSANDSGPGSLRQAILDSAVGDTITFDLPLPSTITLTSGELLVDKDLTITGPSAASLTISENSSLSANRIFEIAPGANVTISGVTITGGVDDLVAGGIYNQGNLTLRASSVTQNSATGLSTPAAGIYNVGTLIVISSTISDNASASGPGGIYNVNGTLSLVNSTISGNTSGLARSKTFQISANVAVSPGGGIRSDGGSVVIIDTTITNNINTVAGDGMAVFGGSVTLKNNIIAGNGVEDIEGIVTSLGYNLIGNGSGATITPAIGDQIGTSTDPIDAMLGPLQDNGGTTQTHALLPGGPAIDKGIATSAVTTDQRGRVRPVDNPAIPPAEGGDNSDIGAFEVQVGQSLNISTRGRVLTGEGILDGGFIITGTNLKKVIIRGLGPSLASSMLSGLLADPVLELHDSTSLLMTNDNWRDTQEADIEATGIPPSNDAESAIVATLAPGAYTAILEGKSGGTGIGLVEVYDLNLAADSTLGNISTRGFVGTGDDVMIGGFIVAADEGVPDQVIVRAIGPSLVAAGITDPLLDPKLELHDQNGTLIASNDNWKDTQEAEIAATGLAPTDDREAAILQTLTAGPYTAIVEGVNATVGIALVEVYTLQ